MRADAAKFSADDLRAAEALYQVANKNWRTAEARQSLETMIEKYPDHANREFLLMMSVANLRAQP